MGGALDREVARIGDEIDPRVRPGGLEDARPDLLRRGFDEPFAQLGDDAAEEDEGDVRGVDDCCEGASECSAAFFECGEGRRVACEC